MNGVSMRFGVAPVQWDWYWDWTVEEALTAEKLDFSSIWILEHHGREDMYYPSPLVALAGLASLTKRVELGSCVLILPLYHPVHVAEDSAMVDVISGGRLILGVGLGYVKEEYSLFQTPMKDRGRRMTESLILIRKLWTEHIVNFKGVFFDVRNFSLQPKPLRKPHPPIWVGGWSSQALERAAELGDAWFIGPVGAFPDVKNSYLKYVDALKKFDKTAERLPLVREIYVAEKSDEAYEKAVKYIGGMYFKDYVSWSHPLVKGAKSFEDVAKDRFIIGSPDDCISQIEKFSRELKITDMIFRVHYPGMSLEEGLKVIRLIAEKIKPYFEEPKR